MKHVNKKIKLDIDYNIFLNKIWRNKIIKLKILSFLSTIEENGYKFIYKYDEIYSVEFMLLNNHYGLLKDKVKRKQYLTFNYGLEYNGINILSICKDDYNGSNLNIPNYKKTIFNCFNNEKENDEEEIIEFYKDLFKNYEELFLSSFENTCRLLVNYNCLIGFKVLQQEFNNRLLKRNNGNGNGYKKQDNTTCIPTVELFINSIANNSLSISNYFYKSFKNKLKYSEKELWSRVLVDNEQSVIGKIQFIINTLPISNNLQITQLKFNIPFYKNQLSKLLECCLIISTLKSNLKNYIYSLESELNDYKLFNCYNQDNSISNNILTIQEIKSMVFTTNEKETLVYKLVDKRSSNDIERLLNMILPFIKSSNGNDRSGVGSGGYFEKSLNYQIFKFKDVLGSKELFKHYSLIGNDKKYLYQQQLKYGIYGNILLKSKQFHYNFKKILKYQTNLEKRKQFLLEFYKNNSDLSITICSISGLCLIDDVDSNLIKFIYSNLQCKEVLPLLENWQSTEIFDYFIQEYKDKFNINLFFLLKNNARELILNHYYNNYNQDYQNDLLSISDGGGGDNPLNEIYTLKNSTINFMFNNYNDFKNIINTQQFWNTYLNYSNYNLSINQFKQIINDYQFKYELSKIFYYNSKEIDQAITWLKLNKSDHLIKCGNCIDSQHIQLNYNFYRYKINVIQSPQLKKPTLFELIIGTSSSKDIGKRVCSLNFSIISENNDGNDLFIFLKYAAIYGNLQCFKCLSQSLDLKRYLEIAITHGHLQLIIYLSSILKGSINFNNILTQSIENENNLLSLNHLTSKINK